jgi:hypothetical protein
MKKPAVPYCRHKLGAAVCFGAVRAATVRSSTSATDTSSELRAGQQTSCQ